MATASGPLKLLDWTSSQPMAGGVRQACPSKSTPILTAPSPAPRQGELLAR